MTKQNLSDTSFLIYTRIDSKDWLLNLKMVIEHIQRYFDANIVVWEINVESKIPKGMKELENISYRIVQDPNPILHNTKYRNHMGLKCRTSYFFINDVDVIAGPNALFSSVEHHRNANNTILMYPYNGYFYDVPTNIREEYIKSGDYEQLKIKEMEFSLWFRNSTGGIFGCRKVDLRKSGPDDEKIYDWRHDDKERYYQLKKEGFGIKHERSPLYHMNHIRKTNSRYANKGARTNNGLEHLKVFKDE